MVQKFNGGGDHFGNFVNAVRSRKHEDLNADILEGHLSSACATWAISPTAWARRSRVGEAKERLTRIAEPRPASTPTSDSPST